MPANVAIKVMRMVDVAPADERKEKNKAYLLSFSLSQLFNHYQDTTMLV